MIYHFDHLAACLNYDFAQSFTEAAVPDSELALVKSWRREREEGAMR